MGFDDRQAEHGYSPSLTHGDGPDSDNDFDFDGDGDSALLRDQHPQFHHRRKTRPGTDSLWTRVYGYITGRRSGLRGEDAFRTVHRPLPTRPLLITAGVIVALFLLVTLFRRRPPPPPPPRPPHVINVQTTPSCATPNPDPASEIFASKPNGTKIYGLIFYGRRATVEILDCYLRKNLVSNGGWLDEVHFLINTPVQEDLDWIEELLPQVEEYRGIHMEKGTDMRDFESVWRQGLQHGNDDLYVKIDDDLVYLSPTAIEEVVTSLITHPEAFIVLGNLIDCTALPWVQHRHGAILSYLPEAEPPSSLDAGYGPNAWRDSALPTHSFSGDEPFYPDVESFENDNPYQNHRWLPLRDNGTHLPETPIWRTTYEHSFGWNHWQLGAQQHYSFLAHLEANNLQAYHFGHRETGLWNMRFAHANINLMAVWARDILDNLPFNVAEDDEAHFSMSLPRQKRRECYIQTRAIAAHFSFGPQKGMFTTDLLGRYRAYANEHVCKEMGIHIKPREEWKAGTAR